MVGAATKTAIRGGADSARGRVMLTTHRSVHLQSNPSSAFAQFRLPPFGSLASPFTPAVPSSASSSKLTVEISVQVPIK